MFNVKKALVFYILLSTYTATTLSAQPTTDDDIYKMIESEYEKGENRHFYPEMNPGQRYIKYAQLCCHAPCCCVSTSEAGRKLIESYMKSHNKTCQGIAITEECFGPKHIAMLEIIDKKQKDDLDAYYQSRKNDNPEQKCIDILQKLPHLSYLFGFITALPISYLDGEKKQSLEKRLPSDIDPVSINRFVNSKSLEACAGILCIGTCLHCICHRAANL